MDEELKESLNHLILNTPKTNGNLFFNQVDIELKEKIIAANNTANEIRKSKRRKSKKK